MSPKNTFMQDDMSNKKIFMQAKYEGTCRRCNRRVEVGELINWYTKEKIVEHIKCAEEPSFVNRPIPKYQPPQKSKDEIIDELVFPKKHR